MTTSPLKSSLLSIFTLSNGMIGSAPMVLPVLYNQYGLINGIFFSVIVSSTSLGTCLVLKKYHKKEEVDLQHMVKRILGTTHSQWFNLVTILSSLAAAQIQIILACTLIYSVLSLIIDTAPQNVFTFSQFSYQILGIIYILILLPIFFIKNITPLLKMPSYASIATFLATIFILFKGSQTPNITTWKSSDVAVLPSVFLLAFLGHSLVVPLLCKSESHHKTRDIIIAYILTFVIYQLLGIFGSFALYEREPMEGTSGFTLLDYFPNNQFFVIILQILLFIQISLLVPIIQFFTRLRFFAFIKSSNPKQYQYLIFSFLFASSCLFCQLLNLNLESLISYTGAIVGAIIGYVLPVWLHLKQKYYNNSKVKSLQVQLGDENQELIQIQKNHTKFEIFIDILGSSIILIIGLGILTCRFIFI